MITIHTSRDLAADVAGQVEALAATAEAADGHAPLNEQAHLLLRRPGATHLVARDGDVLVGYAQWQPDAVTGQLVVDPAQRRRGVGTALFGALPQPIAWAFGNTDAARGFAAASGLIGVRELHAMARPLPADLGGRLPDGIRLTGYADDARDDFLHVNSRAFADHPEQGSFGVADLEARQGEAWWDPEGLILAWDADGLAGFHWVKVHPDGRGEVYVLGVDPRMAGRGVGAGLLQAGLDRLAAQGCADVFLYVDGDNTRAVDLYARSGFAVVVTDVLYAR